MIGKDIIAYQNVLIKTGYREHRKATGEFGIRTEKQVKKFQSDRNLKADGVIGPETYEKMYRHFGKYAKWLLKNTNVPESDVRTKIAKVALYGYTQRDVIHYSQGPKRMTDFAPPPNVPNYTDCSGYATWCYQCAGAPDPNGLGYNGFGYTGTQIENGKKVATPDKGDLVFYGFPVGHVAIYVGDGKVVSHGSEPGPYLLPTKYRADYNHCRSYV